MNKQFTEEEITVANKHEEMFILLWTRECKLKLQWDTILYLLAGNSYKVWQVLSICQEVKYQTLYTAGGIQIGKIALENSLAIFKKVKNAYTLGSGNINSKNIL